ncbi:MAG: hypothetical protein P8I55_01160 [Crocinitomix sp.]|nr:hypothetical protein [Crocinitomix sp.]
MKIISLFFVFSLWTLSANGCGCDWSRNFLELCSESDAVIKFKVKGYEDYQEMGSESNPLTSVVEVLAVYKGLISGEEMRFSGNDGTLCRKFARDFKIGRDYYFQYNYPNDGETPILDLCGEYALLSDYDGVQGDEYQENSTPKMTEEEFMTALEENLGESASASNRPSSNLNDGTARTFSDALLYSLFGVLILLLALFGRVLYRSRV